MNPIICALDSTDLEATLTLAQDIRPFVGAVKLGLEFFTRHGHGGVHQVAALGLPVFLDLKFHDIPNTVAGAIRALQGLPVFMLTIHASGGREMIARAKDALLTTFPTNPPKLIAVTALTSLSAQDLAETGITGNVEMQVQRLAALAAEAGADGAVCSPHEIAALRAARGAGFTLVVPGIRPQSAEKGDQKRTLPPEEALSLGADFLVVGRPITQSANPREAAQKLLLPLCDIG